MRPSGWMDILGDIPGRPIGASPIGHPLERRIDSAGLLLKSFPLSTSQQYFAPPLSSNSLRQPTNSQIGEREY